MKKICIALVSILSIALLVGCNSAQSGRLTMEAVRELAQKGNDLTWSDFESYEGSETGSGLVIMRYPIDENYNLVVGGGSMEETPWYIRLVNIQKEDAYIDIRYDDIDDFIGN